MKVSSSLALVAALSMVVPVRAYAEDVEATPGHQVTPREVTAAPGEGSTYQLPPQDATRTPAWVATGITGVLLVATGVGALGMRSKIEARQALQNKLNSEQVADESNRLRDETLTWRNITFGFAFATLISGAVTGYMWTRQERPRRRTSLTPMATQAGAGVSLDGVF